MCSCFVLRKRSSDIVIIEMRDNLKYKFISGWLRVLPPPPAPSPPPPPPPLIYTQYTIVQCAVAVAGVVAGVIAGVIAAPSFTAVAHCRQSLCQQPVSQRRFLCRRWSWAFLLVSVTPASTALAAKVSTDIQTASPKE